MSGKSSKGKSRKNWTKIGGVCGFIVGLAAVPAVPSLSTALKVMVLSAAPVIGMVGISASIGALVGASLAKKV